MLLVFVKLCKKFFGIDATFKQTNSNKGLSGA